MSERKAWFLVMTPDEAKRPDAPWLRIGAGRGKVVAAPIAPEGWLVLVAFVVLLVAAGLAIWTGGYAAGRLSLGWAGILTLIALTALILALIWIVRLRMTRLPPV